MDDKENPQEIIPIAGTSADPPLVDPHRYRGLRSFPYTPRSYSNMLLMGLDAAAAQGAPMPSFRWPISPFPMRIPLIGRLWMRLFLTHFTAGLHRLGYRIDGIARDSRRHRVVIHAHRL